MFYRLHDTFFLVESGSQGKGGAGAMRAPVASRKSSELEQVNFQVLGLWFFREIAEHHL